MKRFIESIRFYIKERTLFYIFKKRGCIVPSNYENFYEDWLFRDIEPIINSEEMTDSEKIKKLKEITDNYDMFKY